MTDPDEVLARIDHAIGDPEIGPDAMRWTPKPAPQPGTAAGLWRRWEAAGADLSRQFVRLRASTQSSVQKLHRMSHWLWTLSGDTELEVGRRHRERARCRVCRPQSNPPPLAIDGHELHRRRKTRRRRR